VASFWVSTSVSARPWAASLQRSTSSLAGWILLRQHPASLPARPPTMIGPPSPRKVERRPGPVIELRRDAPAATRLTLLTLGRTRRAARPGLELACRPGRPGNSAYCLLVAFRPSPSAPAVQPVLPASGCSTAGCWWSAGPVGGRGSAAIRSCSCLSFVTWPDYAQDVLGTGPLVSGCRSLAAPGTLGLAPPPPKSRATRPATLTCGFGFRTCAPCSGTPLRWC